MGTRQRRIASSWLVFVCAGSTTLSVAAQDEAPPTTEKKEKRAGKAEPTIDAGAVGINVGTDGDASVGSSRWLADDYVAPQSESWFELSRPLIELHGYYRVRTNLFHNFSLGRVDAPGYDPLAIATDRGTPPVWPRPLDDSFTDTRGQLQGVPLCGSPQTPEPCRSRTQFGANMRFRLEPTVRVSENLAIHTQLDMLDNVVLGSTPEAPRRSSGVGADGYQVVARGGYVPLGFLSTTTWTPQGGINNATDAVVVKRAWGEYRSPVGRIRFGRMANHWGMGMLFNGGNGYDDDWQTDVDRIMFTYGFPKYGLYFSGAWDFAASGPVGGALHNEVGAREDDTILNANAFAQGEPYDLLNSDDLDQVTAMIVFKEDEMVMRRRLAQGQPVINAGVYFSYQDQFLASETTEVDSGASLIQSPSNVSQGLVRRNYSGVLTDLWLKVLVGSFRAEIEGALVYGSFDNQLRRESDFNNARDPLDDGWNVRQFGLAAETEYAAVERRLRLGFDFGFASGDSDVANLTPTVSGSVDTSVDPQLTLDRSLSTFRFNPNYRVDLILWRNLLTRVQGAYYFRPHVEYDFLREPDGQRIGGAATMVWSRASEPVQAPGNNPDLGVELDFKLLYQLSPGQGPDMDVRKMGGFYTALEYGVLFPLGGLGYLPGEETAYQSLTGNDVSLSPAHLARWFVGVYF